MKLQSPRIILLTGAVGAVIMAFAGFQLGKPRGAPAASLPMAVNAPAQRAPARTEPAGSRMESMHQPAAAVVSASTITTPTGGNAAAAKLNAASTGAVQSHAMPGALQERSVRKIPVHTASLTPKWPLVLKLADPAAAAGSAALPPQIQAAVQRVQEQFVKEVGGTNQNPADPAYAHRWIEATQRADDLLRAQIGWEAFNAHSLAVAKGAAPAGK